MKKYDSPIKEDWSNVTCEEFDESCAKRGFITTTSIEEEPIIDKYLPSVRPVQYNRLNFHQHNSDVLYLSSDIKEMYLNFRQKV